MDTDWVIDYLSGIRHAVALFPSLLADGVATSIITYIEIYEEIYGSTDPKRSEQIFQEFLESVRG
ncbi:MAG: hypothetical protein ACR2PL_11185 [Dehalococcoidia bacterium]